MTTRRQHYVWQKYLEPWTTARKKSRQLWCLRRDAPEPIFVDTKNVAVEKDFYRMLDLHEGDCDFVRWIGINRRTNEYLRDLNERWIAQFELFFAIHKSARAHPKASARLLKELDQQMIEYQEQAYTRTEGHAVSHLASLQSGDISFFEDDNEAVSFSYFLAHQYFRTKAIRDRIRDTYPSQAEKELFERTWPIFRYIFSTNVGYSIFANRKAMPLQVMCAAPGTEFITADQPAINTYGAFVAPTVPLDELELYYPVSPSRALIISGHSTYKSVHDQEIDPFRVNYLNQAIELVAHEQLFAKSEEALKGLVFRFRVRPQNLWVKSLA